MQDLVYAGRMLRRTPVFTLTAALSLAIGIGGNAAIFSLADALLLRGRPGIAESTTLVDVGRTTRGEGFDNMSFPNFADLRERNTVFSGFAGYRLSSEPMGLGTDNGAERVFGQAVSANYFDLLGVRMALGRGFSPSEDRAGAPHFVVVLSHHAWQQRFAAAGGIVGRVIQLNGRGFTVVGVALEGFRGNTIVESDLWFPLSAYPAAMGRAPGLLESREAVWMVGIARLKPGVTREQALSQVTTIGHELERMYPRENEAKNFAVEPSSRLPGVARGYVAAFVGLLFALAGLVLSIACTNVAGMLLARSLSRAREMALRLAVGAGKGRIIRQLVTESLLLSLVGAGLGILLSIFLIRGLRGVLPALPVAVALDIRLDWSLVTFCALLSIAAGLLFGIAPALQAAKTDLMTAMRADVRSGGSRRIGLRQLYVVAQVSMSVLLVVTALLLVRSLRNADSVSPGFDVNDVEVATIDFRLAGYNEESGGTAQADVLARVERLASVRSAAYAAVVPLTGNGLSLGPLSLPGEPSDDPDRIRPDWNVVSPRYFETMRSAMLRGRTFTGADRGNAPAVAIVNETFARRAWPGEDGVGKLLEHRGGTTRVLHVVGIARDAKYRSLGEAPRAFVYVPLAQHYVADVSLLVKTDETRRVAADLRSVLRQVNRNLPIVYAATLAETTAVGLLPHRLAAAVAGGFGLVGVLLASIGVYGITAYSVTQRTREIGIRVAMGARQSDVLAMIVGQAMRVAGVGAVIGLALAAGVTRLLVSLLYGIGPLDPTAFALGALCFGTLALVASWIPARRAARVRPVEALRSE